MTVVAIANALLDGVMRARFHAEPIVQATELLLQERTPRDVAVAHPRAEEVKTAATVREARPARGAALPLAARRHAADAPAVERPLRGDADRGRLRVQPLGRSRDHALARGRDPRRLGQLRLPARRAERRRCGRPGYQPSGVEPERYDVMFTEDRAEFVRATATDHHDLDVVVSPEDDAEVRRVSVANGAAARARSSSPPTPSSCSRRRPPTPRTRPSPSSSCRPSSSPRAAALLATARRARGAASPRSGRRISPWSKARRWASRDRDRPRALPRPRPRGPHADRGGGRPAALRHRRHRARSHLRAAPPRADPARRRCARRLLDAGRVLARRRARPRRQAPRRDAFERAATLAWTQAQVQLRHLGIDADEAASSSVSPATSSTPTRRCGPRPTPCAAERRQPGALGARASPATCRSCSCGSTTSRTSPSCASCCGPTSTGA